MKTQVVVLAALLLILGPGSSFGTTWTINDAGTGDAPTIQAAIDVAAAGDTILLLPGTYVGVGNRDVSYHGKAVVVMGAPDGKSSAVIDCQGLGRAFDFSSGEGPAAELLDVTIVNGSVSISGGGAIRFNLHSSPTIRGCRMESNQAPVGGAIACWLSSPLLEDCTVMGNSALAGGGGGGLAIHQNSQPTLRRLWVENNSAPSSGGLEIYNSAPSLFYSTIVNNHCTSMGGAMGCQFAAPTIDHCTIVGNASTDSSGGIFLYQSQPQILCSIVAFNQGAGVWCFGTCSTPYLEGTDLWGNTKGDWVGCVAGMELINSNFWTDPLFCDWPNGNYFLSEFSPLIGGEEPCGRFVGAWGPGCAFTSVSEGARKETTSWGTIKKLYR